MLVRQEEIAYKLRMGKQEDKLFRTPLQEAYRRLNPFHKLPVAFGAFAVDIIWVQLPPIGDDPGTPLGKGRADTGRRRQIHKFMNAVPNPRMGLWEPSNRRHRRLLSPQKGDVTIKSGADGMARASSWAC